MCRYEFSNFACVLQLWLLHKQNQVTQIRFRDQAATQLTGTELRALKWHLLPND